MRPTIARARSCPRSRILSATLFALASAMLLLIGVRDSSAALCTTTISSCGCVISSANVFITSGALNSVSSSVDCIDISASGAVLVLKGDITGPGGGVTAVGIHIMSSASNVYISGKVTPGFSATHAKVTGFAVGIQIDGSNAEINLLDAKANTTNGVVFNNVTGGDWNGSAASSNTSGDGVLVSGGSGNIIADTSNANADFNINGIEFSSSSNNRILDSEADSNTQYGIWFGQSSGNEINGTGTNKNTTGTYIGCFSSGGPTGKKCPAGMKKSQFNSMTNSGGNSNSDAGVAIDPGHSGNVIDESGGSSNTGGDAVDKNKKCDHNVWMKNNFTVKSQSCIH
jgi:hypothetical protein